MEDRAPTIFGDGRQTRDFIHVLDVVRGLLLLGDGSGIEGGDPINFGTGIGTTVLELASLLGCPPPRHAPARDGEVRHSTASVDLARDRIGFKADIDLVRGLSMLDH